MLSYNTQLKQLVLPEYGRTIQSMVDYCIEIPDREERTRCAHAIIKAMRVVFPGVDKTEGGEQILWDHLAIISNFRLDVDCPYTPVQPDELISKPDPINHTVNNIRYRHYGKCIIDMINVASNMDPGEERNDLTMLIANHMKKSLLALNKDGVEDEKVFRDLAELSNGEIRLNPETTKLHVFTAAPEPKSSKKRKKK